MSPVPALNVGPRTATVEPTSDSPSSAWSWSTYHSAVCSFEVAITSSSAVDQFAQAWLVDRQLVVQQPRDARVIDLDAEHTMTQLRQARRRDQPDVAGTEHRDQHAWVVLATIRRF
jgi:hypothetical protein